MPRDSSKLAGGRRRHRGWVIITVIWVAMLGVGLFLLSEYKYTAGRAAETPARWPAASSLAREAGRPTLLLFAHPYCPCTRASLDEYASIVAATGSAVTAYVVVLDFEDEADVRETLERVSRIEGARLHRDPDGREAARFGARTSGQTVLYDADGELLFQGGVTAARGHVGDSAGKRKVAELLRPGALAKATQARGAEAMRTAVFGCSLEGPAP